MVWVGVGGVWREGEGGEVEQRRLGVGVRVSGWEESKVLLEGAGVPRFQVVSVWSVQE